MLKMASRSYLSMNVCSAFKVQLVNTFVGNTTAFVANQNITVTMRPHQSQVIVVRLLLLLVLELRQL